ncbi:hypothetical protein [Paraburkholderia susongensis]|uniref:hypothetical protein n=1 Tax=Paraburkholderia susongensis TaxID=1515439 RepID=UPI001ABF94C0|nr:hypothetical protein [Paraburkholderia susongensis]
MKPDSKTVNYMSKQGPMRRQSGFGNQRIAAAHVVILTAINYVLLCYLCDGTLHPVFIELAEEGRVATLTPSARCNLYEIMQHRIDLYRMMRFGMSKVKKPGESPWRRV